MKLIVIGLTVGLILGAVALSEGEHLLTKERHITGPRFEVIVMPTAAGGAAVFLDKDSGKSWSLCSSTQGQHWCALERVEDQAAAAAH